MSLNFIDIHSANFIESLMISHNKAGHKQYNDRPADQKLSLGGEEGFILVRSVL